MDIISKLNSAILLEDHLGPDFQHDNTQILSVSTLPQPVQSFCNIMDKNFNSTIQALRDRAVQLRDAAHEMDDRANQLETAGPSLRETIETWIEFERQSHVRQQSLSLVKTEG